MNTFTRTGRFVRKIIDRIITAKKPDLDVTGKEFMWALLKTFLYYIQIILILAGLTIYFFVDFLLPNPKRKNPKT